MRPSEPTAPAPSSLSSRAGAAPRVALVTGATGAIGAATAERLAADGHAVAVGWRSDRDRATDVVERCRAAGGTATAVRIDVTDPGSIDLGVASIEAELGPVGVLVNNAGRTADRLFLRMSHDDWRVVVATNLDGAFNTASRVVPGMVRSRWGRIVNVASVVGLSGSAGQVNYGAAKAGLIGMTRSLARELASRSVTVNAVAPGPIDSPMLAAVGDERRAVLSGQVPLGRTGTPQEVAAAVTFLCSDDAGYVTGAVLPVDGGLGMGH